MKIKYLLIVGLILTIMTIGAVSASDNVAEDLAVDEVDDVVEEVDDPILNDESMDGDDDCIVYNDSDIECKLYKNINKGTTQNIIEFTSHNSSIIGDLYVYFDDGSTSHRTISSGSYDENGNYYFALTNYDLYYLEMGKTYKVDVELNDEVLLSGTIMVSNFPLYIRINNVYDSGSIEYGDTVIFNLGVPEDATGKLTLTVNGKTYDVEYDDEEGVVAVDTHGWKLGEYDVVVKYGGDAYYNTSTVKKTFTLNPQISYPFVPYDHSFFYLIFMSVGEKETIEFIAPSGTSGKVKVDIVLFSSGIIKSQNVTISNGYGSYTLSGLDAGSYEINIQGSIGGLTIDKDLSLDVFDNSKDVTAGLSASEITVGSNAIVKLSGPAEAMAFVFVDDAFVKGVFLQGGNIAEPLSGLSLGTHEIKVVVFSISTYSPLYSKTFSINVKAKPVVDTVKLTLTKSKVKRSAKKLILKATLKINGKAKKGLVVKFKFNKKTYKAKTNAKGIAKVTIKKTVLKKLKAGKKLTYQASYGKTVKKLTVKVLK